jgi:hypothetical protein
MGEPTLRLPYVERDALLEEIVLDAPPALVEVVGSFEDGPALWDVIVGRGMEGVVAKREREPCPPGARLWVKIMAVFPQERGKASWRSCWAFGSSPRAATPTQAPSTAAACCSRSPAWCPSSGP